MHIFKGFLAMLSAIDSSNTIVGEYMCQGKMPQSVRERYLKMKEKESTLTLRINTAITSWLISQIKSYLKSLKTVKYKEEKDAT